MAGMDFKEYFSKRFIKSFIFGYLRRKVFRDIRVYCMFIGYQRSGHSFIGALLDAHPYAVIGMEVDALDLLQKGYSRNQIYYCLMRNAEVFTKKLKNVWTGYNYAISIWGGNDGKIFMLDVNHYLPGNKILRMTNAEDYRKNKKAEKESPPEADLPMEEKFFYFSATSRPVPLHHKGKICKLVFVGRPFLHFSSRDFPLVPSKIPLP